MTFKIYDPLIEPFYIIKGEHDYTLVEVVTPKETFTENSKPYNKVRSYCANIRSCLYCIFEIKNIKEDKKEYSSLEQYVKDRIDFSKGVEEFIKKVMEGSPELVD